MNARYVIHVLTVAGLLASAGFARAETLFSCDFESPDYILGDPLVGQDSWQQTMYDIYKSPFVGSGIGVNTSQVFYSNPVTSPSGWMTSAALRPFASPLKFDSADTAIELRFWGCAERSENVLEGNLAVSIMWEGKDGYRESVLGIYYATLASANPQAWFRDGIKNMIYGDVLEPGHWYEIKAEIDLSALCDDGLTYGKLTYSYRDATDEDPGRRNSRQGHESHSRRSRRISSQWHLRTRVRKSSLASTYLYRQHIRNRSGAGTVDVGAALLRAARNVGLCLEET